MINLTMAQTCSHEDALVCSGGPPPCKNATYDFLCYYCHVLAAYEYWI